VRSDLRPIQRRRCVSVGRLLLVEEPPNGTVHPLRLVGEIKVRHRWWVVITAADVPEYVIACRVPVEEDLAEAVCLFENSNVN
jgi:hypothetical protein